MPDHSIRTDSHELGKVLSPVLTAEAALDAYKAASDAIRTPVRRADNEPLLKFEMKDYNAVMGSMRKTLGFISDPTPERPLTPDKFFTVDEVLAKMEEVHAALNRDDNCPRIRRVMWGRIVQAVTASLRASGYEATPDSSRGK